MALIRGGDSTGTGVRKEQEGMGGVECPLCSGMGLGPELDGDGDRREAGMSLLPPSLLEANPATWGHSPAFPHQDLPGGLHPSRALSEESRSICRQGCQDGVSVSFVCWPVWPARAEGVYRVVMGECSGETEALGQVA